MLLWTSRLLVYCPPSIAVLGCLLVGQVASADDISFRNDVMAVLSKSGCNLGTCHGNARGKGGFQISLRGQDPTSDYQVLTRDWLSRRANPQDPDRSLLLLKPTQQIAHEGGRRFTVESSEYRLLRDWIAAGMPDDPANPPKLVALHVTPRDVYLDAPKWETQLGAKAEFSDGSTRDVTTLAVYEAAHPIADISHDGLVTGHSTGETTILVRFLNHQVPVRIAFLPERPDFVWSTPAPANFVDEHVFAKLKKLRINPSTVCDDATFVRRVHLDLLGLLPTSEEARRFVADPSSNKRAGLIDSLLERPEFAEWWALKWSDLLRIEEKTLDRKGVENFHAWLVDSFATNKPLDQFVREIVAARGSTYEVPPTNFYRALRTPFERSEAIGQLFLGVRLQCAKCHNHPFDRWTQDDYYSWGSVFARVDYKIIENNRRDTNDKHEFDGEQIVYLSEDEKHADKAKDPRTDELRPAKFLGGNGRFANQADPLDELAQWMTSADNGRFVQMLANRTWQQVIGRGIVDPVDDFRATNPASNPALLKALAEECASHHFDLRHLLRIILNSKTYQLSAEPNATNREDEANFSRSVVRRLSAEQLLDSTSQVCGVPLEFVGYPSGPRAAQLPGVAAKRSREARPTDADRFLRLFGKPPRLQSCDCERSDETTLGQAFQLVSGSLINRMLSGEGNRLQELAQSNRTADEIVTELYWTTLIRPPMDDELRVTTDFLKTSPNRRVALEDIAWGLLNSHEFLLRR